MSFSFVLLQLIRKERALATILVFDQKRLNVGERSGNALEVVVGYIYCSKDKTF
jgi:hypothetical protein